MMSRIVAVVGDVHGEMWAMMRLLSGWEKKRGVSIGAVLQVGDFEPHRTESDLATMASPAKYRKMGDFALFARAEAEFPWPIHFIGGNHEPYGFLEQIPDGGEVAANCAYLGRASVQEISGLRVAALSGVFVPHLFGQERPAVADFSVRSNKDFVAWNEGDIDALLRSGRADVLLLHEWPAMPFDSKVRPDEESGLKYLEIALESLQPRRIFCGHAHFRWSGRWLSAPVECLARIESGRDGFAVYKIEGQEWRELQ